MAFNVISAGNVRNGYIIQLPNVKPMAMAEVVSVEKLAICGMATNYLILNIKDTAEVVVIHTAAELVVEHESMQMYRTNHAELLTWLEAPA